jgi:hypothetical protein
VATRDTDPVDEARAVLARLERIEQLHLAGAPAREILAELAALLEEATGWAELEGDERALRAVQACRLKLASAM